MKAWFPGPKGEPLKRTIETNRKTHGNGLVYHGFSNKYCFRVSMSTEPEKDVSDHGKGGDKVVMRLREAPHGRVDGFLERTGRRVLQHGRCKSLDSLSIQENTRWR